MLKKAKGDYSINGEGDLSGDVQLNSRDQELIFDAGQNHDNEETKDIEDMTIDVDARD